MKWWYIAAGWLVLMLLFVATFHAMVTIRNMEEINFDGDNNDLRDQ